MQALMKADFMLALNSGHNVRRCIICGRYFLLKSGVHALYCEGACPHAPGYTCRQFGSVEVQKELAKDIPKVKVKVTAFARITKDLSRNAISQDVYKRQHHAAVLVVEQLRVQEIIVDALRLAVDAADERLTIPCGFPLLHDVEHHAAHGGAGLRAPLVVHKMYDGHTAHRPSMTARRAALTSDLSLIHI